MIPEEAPNPVFANGPWFLFDWGVVLFAILYFIFSLIVVRQVNLMTETLITQVSGYIRAFAILHAIFALAIVILLIFQNLF